MTKKALYISIALLTLVGGVYLNTQHAQATCYQGLPGEEWCSVDNVTVRATLNLSQTQVTITATAQAGFAGSGSSLQWDLNIEGSSDGTDINPATGQLIIGEFQPSISSPYQSFSRTYGAPYDVSSLPNGTYEVTFRGDSSYGGGSGGADKSSQTSTDTFTINNRPAAPTCSLSFSPSTITQGQQTTATWTSTNDADNSLSYSCTGDIGSGSLTPANSDTPVAPTQSQTCTLTAINSASVSKTCSASITVNAPLTPAPTATLTANPTSVAPGGVPIMSWSSTNAANCSVLAGAGFRTGGAISGSCNTTPGATCPSPLAGDTTFSIRCYEFADRTGRTADAAATVRVVALAPAAPTLSGAGECHANYPNTSVQAYLSWNAVAGATMYEMWQDRSFLIGDIMIAETNQTFYIHGGRTLGASYSYYVIAKNATQTGNPSNTVTVAMPASCQGNPPPSPGGETLVLDPSSATVNVSQNEMFTALYDPDGGGGARYGQFSVNTLATWTTSDATIAASRGNGLFDGVSAGTATVQARYRNGVGPFLNAFATLNVLGAGPSFLVSVAPPLQTVTKPGSAPYTVTVTPLGGFSGNVALSVSNLPGQVSGAFAPQVVAGGSGNSTLTLTVRAGALDGRSTFTVMGTSGALSYSATPDITIQSGVSCSVTADPTSGNAPLTVTAAANGANGTAPYQYRFDWESDGTFDTAYGGNSAQTIYNSAGLYRVTTGVQDATSATAICTTQSTGDVTVNPQGEPQVDLKVRPRGSGGPWHDNLSAGDAMTVPHDYAFNVAQIELSWNSQNVSSCTGSWVEGQEVGTSRAQNNPMVVGLAVPATVGETTTHNLAITCNPTDTVTIEVTKAAAPNCWLTASDNTIIWGQPVILTWGCSATSTVSDLKLVDGAGKAIVDPANPDGGQTKQKPKTTTSYFLKWKEGVAGVDVEVKVDVSVGFLPVLREIIPRW